MFRCAEYTGDGQRCSHEAKFLVTYYKTNLYAQDLRRKIEKRVCGIHARSLKAAHCGATLEKF
jgi:hypothetical protein